MASIGLWLFLWADFVKKKGIDLLLRAADPELELVLCGAGSQIPPQPGTRVLGLVDQSTLAEVYRAADVLVLPSEGEGFPLVVQEALASGLPVVVTDNEVNRDYLDETVAVFTARSPDAIRENTLALLRSPDLRRRMGTAGRMWAVRHFDWEDSVDRYLELYSQAKQ